MNFGLNGNNNNSIYFLNHLSGQPDLKPGSGSQTQFLKNRLGQFILPNAQKLKVILPIIDEKRKLSEVLFDSFARTTPI